MKIKTNKSAPYDFDKKYGEDNRIKIRKLYIAGFGSYEVAAIMVRVYRLDITGRILSYWCKKGIFDKNILSINTK